MEKQNSWEQSYQKISNLWGIEADYILKQYEPLVKMGNVLDLGIGEGRNSLSFALKDYFVEGVDVSSTALSRCKEMFDSVECDYKLHHTEIEKFMIKPNRYSLILSAWTLNFMKKSDAFRIIKDMQKGLKPEGLIYLGVFSKKDPQYNRLREEFEEVDTDTYYIPERDINKSYYDLSELLDLFSEAFEIISCKEDYSLDLGHGEEHYHGAIELIMHKKK